MVSSPEVWRRPCLRRHHRRCTVYAQIRWLLCCPSPTWAPTLGCALTLCGRMTVLHARLPVQPDLLVHSLQSAQLWLQGKAAARNRWRYHQRDRRLGGDSRIEAGGAWPGGAQVVVMDACSGVVAGAVAERLGGLGTACIAYPGESTPPQYPPPPTPPPCASSLLLTPSPNI